MKKSKTLLKKKSSIKQKMRRRSTSRKPSSKSSLGWGRKLKSKSSFRSQKPLHSKKNLRNKTKKKKLQNKAKRSTGINRKRKSVLGRLKKKRKSKAKSKSKKKIIKKDSSSEEISDDRFISSNNNKLKNSEFNFERTVSEDLRKQEAYNFVYKVKSREVSKTNLTNHLDPNNILNDLFEDKKVKNSSKNEEIKSSENINGFVKQRSFGDKMKRMNTGKLLFLFIFSLLF